MQPDPSDFTIEYAYPSALSLHHFLISALFYKLTFQRKWKCQLWHLPVWLDFSTKDPFLEARDVTYRWWEALLTYYGWLDRNFWFLQLFCDFCKGWLPWINKLVSFACDVYAFACYEVSSMKATRSIWWLVMFFILCRSRCQVIPRLARGFVIASLWITNCVLNDNLPRFLWLQLFSYFQVSHSDYLEYTSSDAGNDWGKEL